MPFDFKLVNCWHYHQEELGKRGLTNIQFLSKSTDWLG